MIDIDKNRKRTLFADLALLLVAIFWGSNFVVMKQALQEIRPFTYLGIRFTLAFLILLFLFWKRIRKITLSDLYTGIMIGSFLFMGFAVQTVGLLYTTPAKSGFITGTSVVIVPLLSYFVTKEVPGRRAVLGSILTFLGLFFLSTNGQMTLSYGDLLTLICAFFFAAHIIALGIFSPRIDSIALAAIQLGFTGFANLLIAFFWEPMTMLTSYSLSIWASIFYAVIFCTIGAFVTQTTAQKYTNSVHAALLLSLEAVFAGLFSYLFWGEVFTWLKLLGAGLIFTGIIVVELRPEFFRRGDRDEIEKMRMN